MKIFTNNIRKLSGFIKGVESFAYSFSKRSHLDSPLISISLEVDTLMAALGRELYSFVKLILTFTSNAKVCSSIIKDISVGMVTYFSFKKLSTNRSRKNESVDTEPLTSILSNTYGVRMQSITLFSLIRERSKTFKEVYSWLVVNIIDNCVDRTLFANEYLFHRFLKLVQVKFNTLPH